MCVCDTNCCVIDSPTRATSTTSRQSDQCCIFAITILIFVILIVTRKTCTSISSKLKVTFWEQKIDWKKSTIWWMWRLVMDIFDDQWDDDWWWDDKERKKRIFNEIIPCKIIIYTIKKKESRRLINLEPHFHSHWTE